MTDRSPIIAQQNDRFRSRLGIPVFGEPAVPGSFVFTAGVSALPPLVQLDVWQLVRDYDEFTPGDDPYGEHDFGAFTHPAAGKLFWKIDYYATGFPRIEQGSEDPADPARTHRVLTVMLADEY